MNIDPISGLRSGAARRTAKSRDAGQGFSVETETEPQPAPLTGGMTTAGIENLLVLQEVADEPRRKLGPRARGDAVLDRLEQIRLGLLMGFIPRDQLESLSRLSEGMCADVGDPRLAEVLGEIELRAKVELAKLALPV